MTCVLDIGHNHLSELTSGSRAQSPELLQGMTSLQGRSTHPHTEWDHSPMRGQAHDLMHSACSLRRGAGTDRRALTPQNLREVSGG